jgi:uncharacterized repeat protein (TIGR04138 family)
MARMNDTSFQEAVDAICDRDDRYAADAYYFVREGLDFAVRAAAAGGAPSAALHHVTGRDLLTALRDYALQEFGPLALTVLHDWGVRRTEDFGEIVFNLVRAGRMSKSERDTKDDFARGYDFAETFARPYEAETARPARRKPGRHGRGR